MRAFLIAAALAAGPALADEMVYRQGENTLRLTTQPCTVQAAIAATKPEFAELNRQGVMVIPGRAIQLCWIPVGDTVHTMDEDGDYASFPLRIFKREPGV